MDIRHTHFLPHPPEKVWAFLTRTELLSEWLMQNDFQPLVGHRFQFRAKARVNVGFDGNIYGEVIEVIPFRRLVYSWRGGPGNGKITLDSLVTWTLEEKDGGTWILLEHTGFRGLRNYLPYLIMNKGWSLILKKRLPDNINRHTHEAVG